MRAGVVFPPIVVFGDGDGVLWLGDGYHRLAAAEKAGLTAIDAVIQQGSARDAILHGAGANASHGLRRTQEDKRRAVARLLTDPEWARWSDRKIAEAAKVDHKTVARVRHELSGEFPIGKPNGSDRLGRFPPSPASPAGGKIPTSSIVGRVLASLTDEQLAELRRRGWEVSHV